MRPQRVLGSILSYHYEEKPSLKQRVWGMGMGRSRERKAERGSRKRDTFDGKIC
jgi:hypothetical protein